MLVTFVSLATGPSVEQFESPVEALETGFAEGFAFDRMSFVGRTALGRSGVTLHLAKKHVTGHKMTPIPKYLERLVEHFSFDCAHDGLNAFVSGRNVRIGSADAAILLHWVGSGFEVYGIGYDTEPLIHTEETGGSIH